MIPRLIAWFFVGIVYAVGPLLLLIAVVSSIPKAEFVRNSLVADGKVISLNRVYSKQFSKEVYKPVVRFTANDGQIHWLVADSRGGLIALKPGDKVSVIYLKDQPETARIDSIAQLWMPQLILGFIGVLFTAVVVRIEMRKRALRGSGD